MINRIPTNKNEVNDKRMISFIVPAMNEEETIDTLYHGIKEQIEMITQRWEIIFIDDGSSDATWSEMTRLATEDPGHVKSYQFRKNMGKADALALGYREAVGDLVFTMDADLQDDPKEIIRFIEQIDAGADIVTGWKRRRYDPWHKVLPSRLFNATISRLTGVSLHDHNCGFKAYRKEVVKSLPMYGDMHRMVPSLASFEGYKTVEIPVQHHPRQFGESKYGWGRMLIGLMDTATICFLQRYRECPMHFMGNIALMASALGTILLVSGLGAFVLGTSYGTALVLSGVMLVSLAIAVGAQGLLLEHRVHDEMKSSHELPVANEVKGGYEKPEGEVKVITPKLSCRISAYS